MSSRKLFSKKTALATSVLALAVMSANAQAELTKRFIVKYPDASQMSTMSAQGFNIMAERRQMLQSQGVEYQRSMMLQDYHVITISAADEQQLQQRVKELSESPAFAQVEEDLIMHPSFSPNDPLYDDQWHYFDQQAGINMPAAWERATGKGVTVAVLDTGYRPHQDLVANILPGYDMISDPSYAVDGDGRDNDARDPGDAMKAGECGGGQPTRDRDSSWHGTHVAGTIAAVTNNGTGVAGVAYDAKVVPIRVLGKCGGFTSDIADGIVWAAGGTVAGVPANGNPAQVINMSLGSSQPSNCSDVTQQAINFARSKGTTVVLAAGNSSANANSYAPGNCDGVVSVAASNIDAAKASYSNYGSSVDVTAPGGEWRVLNDPNGVLSTYNSGTEGPRSDSYYTLPGTSMAAPHIAGVVALMYEEKPDITPDEVEQLLKNSNYTNPLTDNCTGCGSGIVDADKVLQAVGGVIVPPIGGSKTIDVDDYWWSGQREVSYTLSIPAKMTSLQVTTSGWIGSGWLELSNGKGESCTSSISSASGSCAVSNPSEGQWVVTINTGTRISMELQATWK